MARQTLQRRSTSVLGLMGAAIAAGSMGFGLIAFGERFDGSGPMLVLALPLVPLVALMVLTVPWTGPAVVFATFPIGFAALEVGLMRLQAVEGALLAVAALVLVRRLSDDRAPLAWSPPLVWIVALVLWGTIALPSAADHSLAIKSLGSLAYGILFASVVITVSTGAKEIRFVLASLIAVSMMIVGGTLLDAGALRSTYGGVIVQGRLQGIFTHPNELGQFCSLVSFVALGLVLSAKGKKSRLFGLVGLGVLLLGLLLSLSRGAWIGTVVAICVLTVTLPEFRRWLLAVSIPLLILAAGLGAFGPTRPQVEVLGARVKSLTSFNQPYDNRPSIWREALRQIGDDPWTGQGPGNFGIASRRTAEGGPFVVYSSHAHNQFLTFGAELGLPAVGLYIAFIVGMWIATKRAAGALRHRELTGDRVLLLCVGAGLVAVVVQGVIDTIFGNPVIGAAMWAMLGTVLAFYRGTRLAVPGPETASIPNP